MDAKARRVLTAIRASVAAGRVRVTVHFTQRMDQRGLFWTDVQAVLDDPNDVRDDRRDRFDRPKWIVAGDAADGERLEIVCALDEDPEGRITVFVTIY